MLPKVTVIWWEQNLCKIYGFPLWVLEWECPQILCYFSTDLKRKFLMAYISDSKMVLGWYFLNFLGNFDGLHKCLKNGFGRVFSKKEIIC